MDEKLQWHPPFRGAVKIELEKYNDYLEYIDEKVLTKKPLLIDLLVIKKKINQKIDNSIEHIFKTWNVMEYKSPTDYVSIDDIYKVTAYAYLLKSDNDTIDTIKFNELTISFVCSSVPKIVFDHFIIERGYEITYHVDGIYYIIKNKEIPIQFIILDELDKYDYKWLAALTDHITKEQIDNLVHDYKEEDKNEYKEAVIETVFKANFDFLKILKEGNNMSNEVLELFRPEIEKQTLEHFRPKIERQAKKQQKTEIIIKMHEEKIDVLMISKVTGLSEEEIQKIIQEANSGNA